jgi:hypothetical protein
MQDSNEALDAARRGRRPEDMAEQFERTVGVSIRYECSYVGQ